MKVFFIAILLLFAIQNSFDYSKMLIIYFTRTGNTELFANYIKEYINMDIPTFKIVPVTSYPEDDNQMFDIVRGEQANNTKIDIVNPLTDISKYDTILLGYPLWFSHLPNIVMTQLEKLNFEGKTVYPFNTHGSSGLGVSINEIVNYTSGANVMEGFPINATMIRKKNESMILVKSWVDKNFGNPKETEGIPSDDKSSFLDYINSNKIPYVIILILLILSFIPYYNRH